MDWIPLSMGFPRQECWSWLPFLSPGELPNPGIKPGSLALQVDSLPSEPPGKPLLPWAFHKEPTHAAEELKGIPLTLSEWSTHHVWTGKGGPHSMISCGYWPHPHMSFKSEFLRPFPPWRCPMGYMASLPQVQNFSKIPVFSLKGTREFAFWPTYVHLF